MCAPCFELLSNKSTMKNTEKKNSHFDPLDLDAPGIRGLVQRDLHVLRDGLPLGQDVAQTLGTQHVPREQGEAIQ